MTENGEGKKIKIRKGIGTETAGDQDPKTGIEIERRDQGQEKESAAGHVTKTTKEAAVL